MVSSKEWVSLRKEQIWTALALESRGRCGGEGKENTYYQVFQYFCVGYSAWTEMFSTEQKRNLVQDHLSCLITMVAKISNEKNLLGLSE